MHESVPQYRPKPPSSCSPGAITHEVTAARQLGRRERSSSSRGRARDGAVAAAHDDLARWRDRVGDDALAAPRLVRAGVLEQLRARGASEHVAGGGADVHVARPVLSSGEKRGQSGRSAGVGMKRRSGRRLRNLPRTFGFGWAGTQNWKNWGRGDGGEAHVIVDGDVLGVAPEAAHVHLWGLSLRLGLSKSQTTSDCPPPVASL